MTILGRTIGLTALIIVLAVTLWVAVYSANRPDANVAPMQPATTSVPPLLLESGTSVPSVTGTGSIVVQPATSTYKEFKNPKTLTSVTVIGPESDGRIRVGNAFVFYGTTTVFENQFAWRVKDDDAQIVASGFAYASSPDTGLPGPFDVKVFFDTVPATDNGKLEVYYGSPKDGSDVMLLTVDLAFEPMKTSVVKVYFTNSVKDPEMLDCSNVYPVSRTVVATERIEEAALHSLLQGTTAAEKKAGYLTQLPERVNDPDMKQDGKLLVLDFDQSFQQGVGGSCCVEAIRSQIENTLGDACDNGSCIIRVNGDADTTLQP